MSPPGPKFRSVARARTLRILTWGLAALLLPVSAFSVGASVGSPAPAPGAQVAAALDAPRAGTVGLPAAAGSSSPTPNVPGPLGPATARPHPATLIDPRAGYSREPAPMGIADFGVTGTGAGAEGYAYAAPSFEGTAFVRGMNVSISDHGTTLHVVAFELNVVLVLECNGTNYTYWIQNGLHVNATSREYTIGGAYVWNFSSPSATFASGELRGNSSSTLDGDVYYDIPSGCPEIPGQCSTLSWPGTLTGRVATGESGGVPYVAYQYDLGSGWVTYDNVSFLHLTGATDVGFVVDGFHATPVASDEFYDAEWDWVAAGGGLSSSVLASNLSMSLDFWNGRNYQAVPTAWNFGSNTGETSTNVADSLAAAPLNGAPAAQLTNGTGSLGVLYNGSEVGYLNVTVPVLGPATLEVGGLAYALEGGGLNLTLAAGRYALALEQYGNATALATVTPGDTTFVDLSGAGLTPFVERGLPAGTRWSVTLAGQNLSSTSSTIEFREPNGTYPVRYGAVAGFVRSASSPSSLLVPVAEAVPVNWTAFVYVVPVSEAGLPTDTPWWLEVGGLELRGTGSTINASVPNGSTPFTVGGPYAYVAAPAAGWLNVTAGTFVAPAVSFGYRWAYLVGTISPGNATLTENGTPVALADGRYNLTVRAGTYVLEANRIDYAEWSATVTATPGNVTSTNLTLTPSAPCPGCGLPILHPTTTSTDGTLIGIGAGAAVVAAVLAAVVLARRRSPKGG